MSISVLGNPCENLKVSKNPLQNLHSQAYSTLQWCSKKIRWCFLLNWQIKKLSKFTSESTRLPERPGPPGWQRRSIITFISSSNPLRLSISFIVSAFRFVATIFDCSDFPIDQEQKNDDYQIKFPLGFKIAIASDQSKIKKWGERA